jgi:hypothetical protein
MPHHMSSGIPDPLGPMPSHDPHLSEGPSRGAVYHQVSPAEAADLQSWWYLTHDEEVQRERRGVKQHKLKEE